MMKKILFLLHIQLKSLGNKKSKKIKDLSENSEATEKYFLLIVIPKNSYKGPRHLIKGFEIVKKWFKYIFSN